MNSKYSAGDWHMQSIQLIEQFSDCIVQVYQIGLLTMTIDTANKMLYIQDAERNVIFSSAMDEP